jgi:hypothetical protein
LVSICIVSFPSAGGSARRRRHLISNRLTPGVEKM